MELDLKGTQLSGYDLVINTALFSEETLESIVPDACPDMLRVLNTHGFVCIKSREARDGHLEVRGVVHTQVLYISDGEETVRHIDISIPFTCGMDHSAIHSGCILQLSASLLSADARMLNPRKVYVRAEIALNVSCYSPYQRKVILGCSCEERLGVQEKRESCQLCTIQSVQDKNFSFSEDLTLPGSKPDLRELLSQRVDISCSESRVIGSKLIIKGQALLTLLYRSADDLPVTACFELPFSQIMEVSDAAEGADCALDVTLSDMTCQPDGEDTRTISVSMSFMAQAVLRESRSVEVLSDVYSTVYELSAEFREDTFCQFSACDSIRQDIREVVETPVPVKAVVDSVLSIGTVSQSWEGKLLQFSADARINILYQSEDGEYHAITRPLSAKCQVETDPNCRCAPWCRCVGERYATPTAGGIEVRVPMEFFYRTEKQEPIKEVVGGVLDEEAACDNVCRPSIVLRMAQTHENLWDIAKAYSTTMQEIMEANELSEQGDFTGRMLLIPKKR